MLNGKKSIIVQGLFYIAALYFLFLLVASHIPEMGKSVTGHGAHYGDLYDLNKVAVFKSKIPDEFPWSDLETFVEVNDADVVLFGDSFVAFNDELLGYELSRETGKNTSIIVYAALRSQGRNNPLVMLSELQYAPKGKTFLVWEKVERLIAREIPEMAPAPEEDVVSETETREEASSFLQEIDTHLEAIYLHKDKIEYTFLNFQGTRWLVSCLSTLRFFLFHELPDLTPKYSLKPNMLFSYAEVDAYNLEFSQEDVAVMADVIMEIREVLEREYNIEMIFLPIPDKYTIYGDLAGAGPYHDFIPRLEKELARRGVPCVNVLPDYMAYREKNDINDLIYYPGDTHWNPTGVRIAAEALLTYLHEQYPEEFDGE
ncbi:MAG: hypothetical protein JW885_10730 [Deltaproteobacteria bacterium]|nr:hypothetical protein [Candidatus Zymogenaceae bacterium]